MLEAAARLPGSTRRRPTRPVMGEVMWRKRQLHLVVLQSSLIGFDRALVLQDELLLIVERLLGDGIPRPGVLVAL